MSIGLELWLAIIAILGLFAMLVMLGVALSLLFDLKEAIIVSGEDTGERIDALSAQIISIRKETRNTQSSDGTGAASFSRNIEEMLQLQEKLTSQAETFGAELHKLNDSVDRIAAINDSHEVIDAMHMINDELSALPDVINELKKDMKKYLHAIWKIAKSYEGNLDESSAINNEDSTQKLQASLYREDSGIVSILSKISNDVKAILDKIPNIPLSSNSELTPEQKAGIEALQKSIDILAKIPSSLEGAVNMTKGILESTINKAQDEVLQIILKMFQTMDQYLTAILNGGNNNDA